ncbi:alpha/beta-Hydrolases superfamily protein [Striga hermonthica]|uniref:Alpha/beta-Hydrolases superfamily protein n=1 Tax=Striga hermonthica TaxID=68872 RepID=A0A9N7R890_STRHE|nr:alpha/beta-Hydrolases superfamily protein [Striga hermonthica]
MEKGIAEETKNEVLQAIEGQDDNGGFENRSVVTELVAHQAQHPYAFHVSGPRNVPSINWRDLISSTWKDPNYKRTVIACFIQAVYLLELDRQENRTDDEHALAPKWWAPFKYRLVEILTDERDGSVFGAILEWDRAAALADFVLLRPSGAPRAVLALRGTLLKGPTIRRDIEDDLRFLTLESLKGSVRFECALRAIKQISEKFGSSNVCVAGHSLGAGFALQVGKALAKEGVCVETHLFNPPSISLASGLRAVGEKAGNAWRKVRSMIPKSNDERENEEVVQMCGDGGADRAKWVPHLYVNNSDYICCYYSDPVEMGKEEEEEEEKENVKPVVGGPGGGGAEAKMFVLSRGKQKFLEAHGLEQWWSDDLEMRMALNSNSKLISRQLKSLHSVPSPPPQ